MAREGMAREGMARDDMAREGMSRDDMAREGMAREGMARDGMAREGMARSVRAIAASVVTVVSVTGCGAGQALMGIHEAPKAQSTSAPLTVDHASKILTRAFTAARQGETATGAGARTALQTAYTGEGLRAARARVRLASVRPTVADSRLLAVSRGFGFPRFIVAQTVASKGGLPVLHLLTSPDAAAPYRISVSADMMPLAKVKPFDALSKGSPLLSGGTGLSVAPATLLSLYAARLAFPTKVVANPPFAADSFSAQLRARAEGVARDVAAQATFTQVHKVVPSSAYAVRQASGDALVFGVMERTDSFEVKSGQAVNTVANKEFVLLTGKKRVTQAASITTLEFVVFAVPRSTGQATLVAAREQAVAGSGS